MSSVTKSFSNVDMTEGNIWRQLIRYAIPLILGDLFQQLYNTADSVIVGRFISKQALAAVGATNTITNIFIGLFSGISVGATVVIAQLYGAREKEKLQNAMQSVVTFTIIAGLAASVISFLCTPAMLRLLDTPEDVYPEALTYLRIYFAGMSGLVVYNLCSGILRAVGDSKRPFLFLVFSSVVNIVLDLLFVIVFKMGVAGAALATIIAQFASAGMLLYILCSTSSIERPRIQRLSIDMKIVKNVISIGLPIGLQKAIIAFSNTIVISKINAFGSGAMAGWSVHRRVDQIIQNVMTSLANATTVFVGQNIGAGHRDRIRKGLFASLCLTGAMTVVLSGIIILGADPIIKLFNGDPDVLQYGRIIIHTIIPFQILSSTTQTVAGYLRGHGDSKTPMYVMIATYVVFRQIYLLLGRQYCGNLSFVLACYPISWLLGTIAIIVILLVRQRSMKQSPLIQSDSEEESHTTED